MSVFFTKKFNIKFSNIQQSYLPSLAYRKPSLSFIKYFHSLTTYKTYHLQTTSKTVTLQNSPPPKLPPPQLSTSDTLPQPCNIHFTLIIEQQIRRRKFGGCHFVSHDSMDGRAWQVSGWQQGWEGVAGVGRIAGMGGRAGVALTAGMGGIDRWADSRDGRPWQVSGWQLGWEGVAGVRLTAGMGGSGRFRADSRDGSAGPVSGSQNEFEGLANEGPTSNLKLTCVGLIFFLLAHSSSFSLFTWRSHTL